MPSQKGTPAPATGAYCCTPKPSSWLQLPKAAASRARSKTKSWQLGFVAGPLPKNCRGRQCSGPAKGCFVKDKASLAFGDGGGPASTTSSFVGEAKGNETNTCLGQKGLLIGMFITARGMDNLKFAQLLSVVYDFKFSNIRGLAEWF